MIDFHCHILPGVDDGARNTKESLAMMRQSFLQGVNLMVSTSHFYGDEAFPKEFLRHRNDAWQRLQDAMLMSPEVYPRVVLGAEVLYFPGISQAEDMEKLAVGDSGCILVEPPMTRWTDSMLDEIAALGRNIGCTPIIAHVDRFMYMLHDQTLMDRVRERGMAVQVNGEYFLDPKTVRSAVKHLKNGNIQLIGSDCHNLDSRPPNLGQVRKQVRIWGAEPEFKQLYRNAADLLLSRKENNE